MNLNDAHNELVKMFHHVNKELYNGELPEPMLCIQSGGKGAKNRLGWFTLKKIWINQKTGEARYEISLTAEHLNRATEQIFETVCHESVHLFNRMNEVKDVAGIHHNKKYRKAALEHGLDVNYDESIGWSITSLNELGKEVFSKLQINEEAFEFTRDFEGQDKEDKEKSPRFIYTCECGTRISKKTPLNIHCNDCDCDFELVDEEGDN